MSLVFLFAACAFALVLGCAVACVDRWREARLAAPRLRPVARIATIAQSRLGRRRIAAPPSDIGGLEGAPSPPPPPPPPPPLPPPGPDPPAPLPARPPP